MRLFLPLNMAGRNGRCQFNVLMMDRLRLKPTLAKVFQEFCESALKASLHQFVSPKPQLRTAPCLPSAPSPCSMVMTLLGGSFVLTELLTTVERVLVRVGGQLSAQRTTSSSILCGPVFEKKNVIQLSVAPVVNIKPWLS